MTGNVCPICGFDNLHEQVRGSELSPTYEICPSCGFEFGVTDDDEGETYESWRAKWVADGMRWWAAPAELPPPGWDPRIQLAGLG